MATTVERQGPYGSSSQTNWFLDLTPSQRIVEVQISSDLVIHGIGFVIADTSGGTISRWIGGRGRNSSSVKLKNNEYITKLSGSYGMRTSSGYCTLATLKVHTNKRASGYGPFGHVYRSNISEFSTSMQPSGAIVGFHGRSGSYLESIGPCVKKVSRPVRARPLPYALIPKAQK